MKYNNGKLKTSEDSKVMWRTYHYRKTNGLVEFDATIARYVEYIIKTLKHP